jgi:hypothetical protein
MLALLAIDELPRAIQIRAQCGPLLPAAKQRHVMQMTYPPQLVHNLGCGVGLFIKTLQDIHPPL